MVAAIVGDDNITAVIEAAVGDPETFAAELLGGAVNWEEFQQDKTA